MRWRGGLLHSDLNNVDICYIDAALVENMRNSPKEQDGLARLYLPIELLLCLRNLRVLCQTMRLKGENPFL
jgi:hypothetical protein